MADGAEAEARAAEYLVRQGLKVIGRNFRCRLGEIDLIARDGETLVFVEVRSRRNAGYGGALASVDGRKQQRLIAAAQYYLARQAYLPPCRFDVVALEGAAQVVHWVRNAFEAD